MSNTVCRNFEYKDLDSIHLNCDKCKFNGNCDIQTAYHKPKDYFAVSMGFVDMKEAEAPPITENITKGFEEFTKMMFKQGQAKSEE